MDEELEEISPLVISEGLLKAVPEIGHLKQTLTCLVCYELLQAPVITSCSHTFCSLCVRKYLQYKPQCPKCFATTYEQNLRSNKAVEEIVGHFKPLIERVEDLANKKGILQNKVMKENILPSCESKKEVKVRSPSKTALKDLPKDNSDAKLLKKEESSHEIVPKPTGLIKKNNKSPKVIIKQSPPSTPSKTLPELPTLDKPATMASSSSSSQNSSAASKSVCPVCNVDVPTQNINKHLNFCLLNKDQSPVASKVTRKPLPKLVYALLKESDLRKRCKEFGLNAKGDKRTLVARHQKYTLLYNTECDLEKPRSKMQIQMQVEREEIAEKRGAGSTSTPTRAMLGFDRKTDPVVIEEKQKQYMHQNKSTFQELVEQAKKNRKKKNEVVDSEVVKNAACFSLKNTAIEIVDSADESNSSTTPNQAGPIELKTPRISLEQEGLPQNYSKFKNKEADVSFSSIHYHMPEPSDTISNVGLDSQSRDKPIDIDTPLFPEVERTPVKQSKSHLYLTPKKDKIENLLKSPSLNQISIFQSLTQSAERSEKLNKINCPGGCGLQITEKYLNIHLDKCLRDTEVTEPSPVFESKRNVTKKKITRRGEKNVRVVGVMPKTHDISESDSCESENDEAPEKRKILLRKRINKKPIIDSDEEDDEQENNINENEDNLNDSPMSPNLLDTTPDDTVSKPSRSKNQSEETSEFMNQTSTNSCRSKDMFDDDSDFDKSTDVDEPTPPINENKFVENCNDDTHNGDITGDLMDIDDDIEDLLEAAMAVENTQKENIPTSPINWTSPLVSSSAKAALRGASQIASSSSKLPSQPPLTSAAKFEISQPNSSAKEKKCKEKVKRKISQDEGEGKVENERERRSTRLRKKK